MILKMQQKQRLFIYDRKEMGVLLLLAALVAIFAFTMGVHLGKRVGPKPPELAETAAPLGEGVEDRTGSAQDLTDQNKGAALETEEALDKAAHDEVSRTGLKLDQPKQVDLPAESKSEKMDRAEKKNNTDESLKVEDLPAFKREAPAGKYWLQIGSHQKIEEAQALIAKKEALGLKPFLRIANLAGRGQWYRVYIEGYPNKAAADLGGTDLQKKGLIESFVVANALK